MILLGRPQWIVIRKVKETDVYVAVVSFLLAGLSDTKTKLFPPDTQMKTWGRELSPNRWLLWCVKCLETKMHQKNVHILKVNVFQILCFLRCRQTQCKSYLYMKGKHWRWSVGKRTIAPPSYIIELALHLVASDKVPGYLQFLLRSWNRQTDTDPHWQSSFLGFQWGWKTKRTHKH